MADDLTSAGTDAVVVGAGIVGLTAALRLQEGGRRVTIVTADAPHATTSQVAAAVWYPTRVGPAERVVGWAALTYEVLTATARDHPEAGVLLRDTVALHRDDPGRPWWTAAVPVHATPTSELPPGYRHGLSFTVPLAVMPTYLAWLVARFRSAGGTLRRRRLTSLDDLAGAPLIVNAAGLGARELVGDPTLVPLRGQVVRTTNPGLTVSYRDEHHPEGYTYIHPRLEDCVLGGTLDVGAEDTTPDEAVTAAILRRCRAIEPRLGEARVLEVAVGLRPARPAVRLEADDDALPGARVVHDYGHGGAGVTLAWGCADEVVRLADA